MSQSSARVRLHPARTQTTYRQRPPRLDCTTTDASFATARAPALSQLSTPNMAPTRKREGRENNYYNVGVQGRYGT
jgi:hypothetical protein